MCSLSDDYDTINLRAVGTTFVTEQMDTNASDGSVTVATLVEKVKIGRKMLEVDAACKLVNQDRVNSILQLDLPAPAGTCRDVNELTHTLALNSLSDRQRERYLSAGVQLRFVADYEAAAGGEWLPSIINDFIKPVSAQGELAYLSVQAPSVQV